MTMVKNVDNIKRLREVCEMDDNQEVSKNVPASEFKAKCLALLDEVAQTDIPLTITKRGKAIAKVVPLNTAQAPSLLGSVRYKRES
jgi:prevent-host-death family protein